MCMVKDILTVKQAMHQLDILSYLNGFVLITWSVCLDLVLYQINILIKFLICYLNSLIYNCIVIICFLCRIILAFIITIIMHYFCHHDPYLCCSHSSIPNSIIILTKLGHAFVENCILKSII